jgi:hypothetical protein
VLVLRVLAILGTVCFNLIPNYARDNWVSIGWGMIYLAFNAVRAVEIVRDRTSTTQSLGFSEDEMAVYASKFHRHMPPRRFQNLLKVAEWREVDAGAAALDCATECGLLVRGRCSVSKHGETLLVANAGMFLAVPHLDAAVGHPKDAAEDEDEDGGGGGGEGGDGGDSSVAFPQTAASAASREGQGGLPKPNAQVVATSQTALEPAAVGPQEVAVAQIDAQTVEITQGAGAGENAQATVVAAQVCSKVEKAPPPTAAASAIAAAGAAASAVTAAALTAAVAVAPEIMAAGADWPALPLPAPAAAGAAAVAAAAAALATATTVRGLEPSLVLVWPVAALRAHLLKLDEAAAASLLRVFHDGLVEQTHARDHALGNEKYASLLRRCVPCELEVNQRWP